MIKMKNKVVALAITVGLVTGGTTYAAAGYFADQEKQFKERYTVNVMAFMNDRENPDQFKKDEAARIEKEANAYLEKKLKENENYFKEPITDEANRVIENLKKHIDAEIKKYN
jgi:hypothetical protein